MHCKILVLTTADGLKLTSIEVPAAVMNSSQVVLVCNYVLEGDQVSFCLLSRRIFFKILQNLTKFINQLYSVKWYKNYVEFYRFQPIVSESSTLANTVPATASNDEQAEMEAKQGFELDGIYLDVSITLMILFNYSRGKRCEPVGGANWGRLRQLKQLTITGFNELSFKMTKYESSQRDFKCQVHSKLVLIRWLRRQLKPCEAFWWLSLFQESKSKHLSLFTTRYLFLSLAKERQKWMKNEPISAGKGYSEFKPTGSDASTRFCCSFKLATDYAAHLTRLSQS